MLVISYAKSSSIGAGIKLLTKSGWAGKNIWSPTFKSGLLPVVV